MWQKSQGEAGANRYPLGSHSYTKSSDYNRWSKNPQSDSESDFNSQKNDEEMRRTFKNYLDQKRREMGLITANHKGECGVCGIGVAPTDGYCKNESCSECHSNQSRGMKFVTQRKYHYGSRHQTNCQCNTCSVPHPRTCGCNRCHSGLMSGYGKHDDYHNHDRHHRWMESGETKYDGRNSRGSSTERGRFSETKYDGRNSRGSSTERGRSSSAERGYHHTYPRRDSYGPADVARPFGM